MLGYFALWLAILMLVSIVAQAHESQSLTLPIITDTISTKLPLPAPLDDIDIRIRGIDAPEMPAKSYLTTGKLNKAKCKKEAELALQARAAVVSVAETHYNTMIVKNYSWDKYGSRIDADVYFGDVNIAEKLIVKTLTK